MVIFRGQVAKGPFSNRCSVLANRNKDPGGDVCHVYIRSELTVSSPSLLCCVEKVVQVLGRALENGTTYRIER